MVEPIDGANENKAIRFSDIMTNIILRDRVDKSTFEKAVYLLRKRPIFEEVEEQTRPRKKIKPLEIREVEVAPPVCEFKTPVQIYEPISNGSPGNNGNGNGKGIVFDALSECAS